MNFRRVEYLVRKGERPKAPRLVRALVLGVFFVVFAAILSDQKDLTLWGIIFSAGIAAILMSYIVGLLLAPVAIYNKIREKWGPPGPGPGEFL